jgi:hypothetical protein
LDQRSVPVPDTDFDEFQMAIDADTVFLDILDIVILRKFNEILDKRTWITDEVGQT